MKVTEQHCWPLALAAAKVEEALQGRGASGTASLGALRHPQIVSCSPSPPDTPGCSPCANSSSKAGILLEARSPCGRGELALLELQDLPCPAWVLFSRKYINLVLAA